MAAGRGVFIIGAKRSPFCKHGGPLRDLPASHVFAAAAKDAIQAANVDPAWIDNTVVGNIMFLSQCDGGKTPRYCGLYSGVPITSPALGVNKTCGSGLQAVITSSVDILTGISRITLTGGTELMSALPFLARNVRFGTSLGASYQLDDHIKKLFIDSYTGLSLQFMAEELAKKYKVSRQDVDEFTYQAHLKWKTVHNLNTNIFEKEISSVTVTTRKKTLVVNKDILTEPDITLGGLHNLPALLEDGRIITAGNTSAPADGAAALLIASEEAVKAHDLQPLARVAGFTTVGVDPMDSGIAGVAAVRKLLGDKKIAVDDVDLFEINDSFASNAIITAQELKVDLGKVNVSGGALASGHPVSATGARMITHLVHQMSRRNLKKAIATSGCGGGQGVAVLLENV